VRGLPRDGSHSKHPDEALGAVQPQVCVECHEDQIKEVAGSIHGKRAAGKKAIKDCTGCHDSLHKVHKSGDPIRHCRRSTRSRPAAPVTKR
jgi:hypothetical protein